MENNVLGKGVNVDLRINYVLPRTVADDPIAIDLLGNLITSIKNEARTEVQKEYLKSFIDYIDKDTLYKIFVVNKLACDAIIDILNIVNAKKIMDVSVIRRIDNLLTNVGFNTIDVINTLRRETIDVDLAMLDPDIELKNVSGLSIAVLGNKTMDGVVKRLISEDDSSRDRLLLKMLIKHVVDNNNSDINTRVSLIEAYSKV